MSISNRDTKCLLYCIAAAHSSTTELTDDEKPDPSRYTEFADLIRVTDNKDEIDFPININDNTELDRINRGGFNSLNYRISVFREHITSKIVLG